MEKQKIPLVVLALGGNALLQRNQKGTIEDQRSNAKIACKQIVQLISKGYNVQLVHGNGPQVGNIFRRNMLCKNDLPPDPLDICGAESQGLIGDILQEELSNQLLLQKVTDKNVVTVVTRVVVDKDDSAFKNPTKPVGQFYKEEQAKELEKEGYFMKEDSGRGWRFTVPSPIPKKVVEIGPIRDLINTKTNIVISCGGGGIPCIENEDGTIRGFDGVIDKDRAGCLLAHLINADIFIILTDIEFCYINFNKPNQEALHEITVSQAQKYLDEGHFAKGSMGPKVESCIKFVSETGNPAYIASLEKLMDVLDGKSGTKIIADKK